MTPANRRSTSFLTIELKLTLIHLYLQYGNKLLTLLYLDTRRKKSDTFFAPSIKYKNCHISLYGVLQIKTKIRPVKKSESKLYSVPQNYGVHKTVSSMFQSTSSQVAVKGGGGVLLALLVLVDPEKTVNFNIQHQIYTCIESRHRKHEEFIKFRSDGTGAGQ